MSQETRSATQALIASMPVTLIYFLWRCCFCKQVYFETTVRMCLYRERAGNRGAVVRLGLMRAKTPKIGHLRYLTDMWFLLCSKSFYRFILTNFVPCFVFVLFFSIPNLKLMLQTVSRCSTWGHKSDLHQLCTTLPESSMCVQYLFIHLFNSEPV